MRLFYPVSPGTAEIGGVGDYKEAAPTSPVTMSFPSGENANALRVFLENIGISLITGLLQREKRRFYWKEKGGKIAEAA